MYNTKSDKPRFEILQLAEAAVTDREKQYSSPDVNYDRVARIVQVILQNKLRPEAELSPVDHPVHFQLPVCCYRSDNMRQLAQTQ